MADLPIDIHQGGDIVTLVVDAEQYADLRPGDEITMRCTRRQQTVEVTHG